MNDANFFGLIERAWTTIGGFHGERSALLDGSVSSDQVEALVAVADGDFVVALTEILGILTREELRSFDYLLARKLFELDREDIHEFSDGSDDGFLYSRGFIVAMGSAYFHAVTTHPFLAIMEGECEAICFLPDEVYRSLYGEELPRHDGTPSRESGANVAGWLSDSHSTGAPTLAPILPPILPPWLAWLSTTSMTRSIIWLVVSSFWILGGFTKMVTNSLAPLMFFQVIAGGLLFVWSVFSISRIRKLRAAAPPQRTESPRV